MNIQSVSIVVPINGSCMNNCPYCVSRQHHENYGKNNYGNVLGDRSVEFTPEYLNRLKYIRANGCNTIIFTGTNEPQQNIAFMLSLMKANKEFANPFYNIEMQTTGAELTYNDLLRLEYAGLTTIAFSVSSFDEMKNEIIINNSTRSIPLYANIRHAKALGMNVRICINLTSYMNDYKPEDFFDWANEHEVDQLTFRKIYSNDKTCPQNKWINEHEYKENGINEINNYIKAHGTPIARLPYGFVQYSVNGISTVLDTDCMSKDNIDEMKYAILRPNGHLYSRWDDKGSLIF